MGKTASKICSVVSPVRAICKGLKEFSDSCAIWAPIAAVTVGPAAGLVLGAVAAGTRIIEHDRQRRKANTGLDDNLRAQESAAIAAEEHKLQQELAEIHQLYQEQYGYLSKNQAVMEEYYLTIKTQLAKEQIFIDNLPEILDLLDACARGEDNQKIIAGLLKFRDQINILLNWGIMHIALLANDPDVYNAIEELANNTIDGLNLDNLGHTILEYVHLSGDKRLLASVKKSTFLVNRAKELKEAEITLASKNVNRSIVKHMPRKLVEYSKSVPEVAKALITLDELPQDPVVGNAIVTDLVVAGQHATLKHLLAHKPKYINYGLIKELEAKYPYAYRGNNNESCIDILKAYTWLYAHGFAGINNVHPQTNKIPLEMLLEQRAYNDFINLVICGADVLHPNIKGENALMIAARTGYTDAIEYLVNKQKMDPRGYLNENPILTLMSTQDVGNRNFVQQASYYSNLWRQGKIPSQQVRSIIVTGLYVLGVSQILPLTEQELPWISKALDLNVTWLDSEQEFNDTLASDDQVYVTKSRHGNGYQAKWLNNTITTTLPDIEYSNPMTNDLIELHTETAITNYINSNYQLLEDFVKNQQRRPKYLPATQNFMRINELQSKGDIKSSQDFNTNSQFKYFYPMPERDAGYHALGMSRLTAAQVLIEELDDPEILDCIKIEWANWVASFSILPLDLQSNQQLATIFAEYRLAEQQPQTVPSELEVIIAKIANIASRQDCVNYIGKVIAAPHNYLNSVKYYPATSAYKAGGALVALAKLAELNIRIWGVVANEMEEIFTYFSPEASNKPVLNLWHMSPIANQLTQVAILSDQDNLQFRPVITHVDLFASVDINTDLGAILHGWFSSLISKAGFVPHDDILALLLQVKASIDRQSSPLPLTTEIYKYRQLLSTELSDLLGEQLSKGEKLDKHWLYIADKRIRNWSQQHLLKEHCQLINDYKNQVESFQQQFSTELQDRCDRAQIEHDKAMANFEQSLAALNIWRQEQEQTVINESNQHKSQIHNEVNYQLATKHAMVKRQCRRGIRATVVDFLIDRIIPKANTIPMAVARGAAVSATASALKGEQINPRHVAVGGISGGFSAANLQLQGDLTKMAIAGMAENLITGVVLEQQSKDIFKRTVLGGVQAVCQYGIMHQMKFSDNYVKAIFSGSIEGVLEGIKTGQNSVEDILMAASNKIANNVTILQYQAQQEAIKQLAVKLDVADVTLTQDEIKDKIILQQQQSDLLVKIEQQLSLYAKQEALAAREIVDVEQYMKVLAPEVAKLNSEQLNSIGTAIDYRIMQSNSASAAKVQEAALVLPAVAAAGGAALATYGLPLFIGYLVYKASNESLEYFNNKMDADAINDVQTSSPGFPDGIDIDIPADTAHQDQDLPKSLVDKYIFGQLSPDDEPKNQGFPANPVMDPVKVITLLFNETKEKQKQAKVRVDRGNPYHEPVRVPKEFRGSTGTLPGFPGAKHMGKKNGRHRWKLEDGKFFDWDSEKGELEMFNKTGKKHFGGFDPYTGRKRSKSVPGRTSRR